MLPSLYKNSFVFSVLFCWCILTVRETTSQNYTSFKESDVLVATNEYIPTPNVTYSPHNSSAEGFQPPADIVHGFKPVYSTDAQFVSITTDTPLPPPRKRKPVFSLFKQKPRKPRPPLPHPHQVQHQHPHPNHQQAQPQQPQGQGQQPSGPSQQNPTGQTPTVSSNTVSAAASGEQQQPSQQTPAATGSGESGLETLKYAHQTPYQQQLIQGPPLQSQSPFTRLANLFRTRPVQRLPIHPYQQGQGQFLQHPQQQQIQPQQGGQAQVQPTQTSSLVGQVGPSPQSQPQQSQSQQQPQQQQGQASAQQPIAQGSVQQPSYYPNPNQIPYQPRPYQPPTNQLLTLNLNNYLKRISNMFSRSPHPPGVPRPVANGFPTPGAGVGMQQQQPYYPHYYPMNSFAPTSSPKPQVSRRRRIKVKKNQTRRNDDLTFLTGRPRNKPEDDGDKPDSISVKLTTGFKTEPSQRSFIPLASDVHKRLFNSLEPVFLRIRRSSSGYRMPGIFGMDGSPFYLDKDPNTGDITYNPNKKSSAASNEVSDNSTELVGGAKKKKPMPIIIHSYSTTKLQGHNRRPLINQKFNNKRPTFYKGNRTTTLAPPRLPSFYPKLPQPQDFLKTTTTTSTTSTTTSPVPSSTTTSIITPEPTKEATTTTSTSTSTSSSSSSSSSSTTTPPTFTIKTTVTTEAVPKEPTSTYDPYLPFELLNFQRTSTKATPTTTTTTEASTATTTTTSSSSSQQPGTGIVTDALTPQGQFIPSVVNVPLDTVEHFSAEHAINQPSIQPNQNQKQQGETPLLLPTTSTTTTINGQQIKQSGEQSILIQNQKVTESPLGVESVTESEYYDDYEEPAGGMNGAQMIPGQRPPPYYPPYYQPHNPQGQPGHPNSFGQGYNPYYNNYNNNNQGYYPHPSQMGPFYGQQQPQGAQGPQGQFYPPPQFGPQGQQMPPQGQQYPHPNQIPQQPIVPNVPITQTTTSTVASNSPVSVTEIEENITTVGTTTTTTATPITSTTTTTVAPSSSSSSSTVSPSDIILQNLEPDTSASINTEVHQHPNSISMNPQQQQNSMIPTGNISPSSTPIAAQGQGQLPPQKSESEEEEEDDESLELIDQEQPVGPPMAPVQLPPQTNTNIIPQQAQIPPQQQRQPVQGPPPNHFRPGPPPGHPGHPHFRPPPPPPHHYNYINRPRPAPGMALPPPPPYFNNRPNANFPFRPPPPMSELLKTTTLPPPTTVITTTTTTSSVPTIDNQPSQQPAVTTGMGDDWAVSNQQLNLDYNPWADNSNSREGQQTTISEIPTTTTQTQQPQTTTITTAAVSSSTTTTTTNKPPTTTTTTLPPSPTTTTAASSTTTPTTTTTTTTVKTSALPLSTETPIILDFTPDDQGLLKVEGDGDQTMYYYDDYPNGPIEDYVGIPPQQSSTSTPTIASTTITTTGVKTGGNSKEVQQQQNSEIQSKKGLLSSKEQQQDTKKNNEQQQQQKVGQDNEFSQNTQQQQDSYVAASEYVKHQIVPAPLPVSVTDQQQQNQQQQSLPNILPQFRPNANINPEDRLPLFGEKDEKLNENNNKNQQQQGQGQQQNGQNNNNDQQVSESIQSTIKNSPIPNGPVKIPPMDEYEYIEEDEPIMEGNIAGMMPPPPPLPNQHHQQHHPQQHLQQQQQQYQQQQGPPQKAPAPRPSLFNSLSNLPFFNRKPAQHFNNNTNPMMHPVPQGSGPFFGPPPPPGYFNNNNNNNGGAPGFVLNNNNNSSNSNQYGYPIPVPAGSPIPPGAIPVNGQMRPGHLPPPPPHHHHHPHHHPGQYPMQQNNHMKYPPQNNNGQGMPQQQQIQQQQPQQQGPNPNMPQIHLPGQQYSNNNNNNPNFYPSSVQEPESNLIRRNGIHIPPPSFRPNPTQQSQQPIPQNFQQQQQNDLSVQQKQQQEQQAQSKSSQEILIASPSPSAAPSPSSSPSKIINDINRSASSSEEVIYVTQEELEKLKAEGHDDEFVVYSEEQEDKLPSVPVKASPSSASVSPAKSINIPSPSASPMSLLARSDIKPSPSSIPIVQQQQQQPSAQPTLAQMIKTDFSKKDYDDSIELITGNPIEYMDVNKPRDIVVKSSYSHGANNQPQNPIMSQSQPMQKGSAVNAPNPSGWRSAVETVALEDEIKFVIPKELKKPSMNYGGFHPIS